MGKLDGEHPFNGEGAQIPKFFPQFFNALHQNCITVWAKKRFSPVAFSLSFIFGSILHSLLSFFPSGLFQFFNNKINWPLFSLVLSPASFFYPSHLTHFFSLQFISLILQSQLSAFGRNPISYLAFCCSLTLVHFVFEAFLALLAKATRHPIWDFVPPHTFATLSI